MSHRLFGRLSYMLAATVFASCLSVPADSQAGPLLDWLYKKRQARRVALSPAGCSGNGAYCEQTVVNYVPQTSYRTVWQAVPVTTYRRTTHCNPTTGLPITCTRPCTSYTYQARRVPYTSYRPVYSRVPVSSTNVNYMPAVTKSGCNSCSVGGGTGYSTIPNYGSPGYSIPSSRTPQYGDGYSGSAPGATPWTSVNPRDRYENYDDRGGSDDPANSVPAVSPRGIDPKIEDTSYSRALQRIPSTSRQTVNRYRSDPYYRGRASSRYDDVRYEQDRYERDRDERDRYERSRFDRERPTDAYTERSNNRRQNISSDDTTSRYARVERDVPTPAPNSEFGESVLRRDRGERSMSRPNARANDLQPVPNEAPRRIVPRKELPPLLNTGRDREASIIRPIATRWASNKIYWSEVSRVERRRDRNGDRAVRQASATEPVAPFAKSTARPIRRDDTIRFSGDDRWESNSERATSPSRQRERKIDDSGWTSNR